MPRGGRRDGSGRKPILNYSQLAWVYLLYKKFENEARMDQVRNHIAAEYQGREMDKLQKRINSSDVSQRRQIITLAGMDDLSKASEEIPEWVVNLANDLKDIRKNKAEKRRIFEFKRLYGGKKELLKIVSEHSSEKFGKTVTENYVKRIVDDREGFFANPPCNYSPSETNRKPEMEHNLKRKHRYSGFANDLVDYSRTSKSDQSRNSS